MDVAIHWGVLKRLQGEVSANPAILVVAILFDLVAVGALLVVKGESDPLLLILTIIAFVVIFAGEKWFLTWGDGEQSG